MTCMNKHTSVVLGIYVCELEDNHLYAHKQGDMYWENKIGLDKEENK